MKKILSLVLAMLMIISMVPAVFAAETESESDYQAAIDYLAAIGLWKGYGDGEDGSDDQVLRYQMALFTARMSTGRVDKAYWETDVNDSGFTDIDALDAEGLGGVTYAAQQGIVNGIGGGEFAPFDNVTYRDAIVMIVRALGFNYPASGYPWSYINKARELGVLDGITGVTYTVEVKREVIAQLLYNALNAEIAGATLAETAFGVAETIVMVTATEQIVYGAGASKSIKSGMVRVAALDVDGEPMGTEYYAPLAAVGAKNIAQANKLVGTTLKLTHKNNFSEFLAYEKLSQEFENTPEKKEVTVAGGKITFNKDSYTILAANADYSNITNNQGTLSGNNEIKVFKAFGATQAGLNFSEYVLAANGNIYSVNNPFEPYAIYSALVDKWFKVVTDEIVSTPDANGVTTTVQNKTYVVMTDAEVADLLKLVVNEVEGFTNIGANSYINTRIASDYGVPYDYYKAIASDIDGDGDFDRVTVRQYALYRISKGTTKINGQEYITFDAVTYTSPVNSSSDYTASGSTISGIANYTGANGFRVTGTQLNSVPNGAFVVAYINNGVNLAKEIEIVEVIGGAKSKEDDTAYTINAYLRGYDSTTNSVIFGSTYETLPFGYFGVVNSTAYAPTEVLAKNAASWYSTTANYLRQYWNTYVTLYVLNGRVIFVEPVLEDDQYVILDSFTDFTEDGLKAMAYSTVAGGYAEITISELNGWNLGGFDYELFTLLKQMADLGLTVKDYPLPVSLKTVYKVRYVAEDGSYNLVAAGEPYAKDKNVYVNNFGYILGVDKDGKFDGANRVPTSDKDLWIILQGDKIHMFQGKLSTVELIGLDFYKAKANQFVAVADLNTNLGPILGNVNEGVDYWVYNELVDKYYNKDFFGTFTYGHFMTNMRTGAIEFITYDPTLAYDQFNGLKVPMVEGGIYKAVKKVLKSQTLYTVKDVADTEFATGEYNGKKYDTVAVGAILPAGLDLAVAIQNGILTSDINAAYNSYEDLVDAMALHMYEVIYDKDFTNSPLDLDVYAAIKVELMTNVTFVNYTAAGAREAWKGYANYAFTSKTLGTDKTYVKAYVMYDYADMSAKVFIDSYNAIEPADAVVETTATPVVSGVTGVTANAKLVSNLLADKTTITVQFSDKVVVTDVVAGDYDVEIVELGTKYAIFSVPTANFGADVEITTKALDTSAENKVSGLSIDESKLFGVKVHASTKDKQGMFDGVNRISGLYNNSTVLQWTSFATHYTADFQPVAAGSDDAKYWCGYIIDIAEATDLSTMRIDYGYYRTSKTAHVFPSYEILVSADGVNWTVAATTGNLIAAGEYTEYDADTEAGTIAGAYVDIVLQNATGVKYVAVCATSTQTEPAAGQRGYTFIAEVELYK